MIEKIKICIELLDEGVGAYIEAYAEPLRGEFYRLLEPDNHDPEDLLLDFAPGSVITLKEQRLGDGKKHFIATHPDPRAVRIMMPSSEEFAPPWRETYALDLGEKRFEVQATPHYTPEQKWEYPPGSVIRLKRSMAVTGWVPDGLAE